VRTSSLSAGVRICPSPHLCGRPHSDWLLTLKWASFLLHLFPRVHSDSFYANLISSTAVLCSEAILSSCLLRGAIKILEFKSLVDILWTLFVINQLIHSFIQSVNRQTFTKCKLNETLWNNERPCHTVTHGESSRSLLIPKY